MQTILYPLGLLILTYVFVKTIRFYNKTGKLHSLGFSLSVILVVLLVYYMPKDFLKAIEFLGTPLGGW